MDEALAAVGAADEAFKTWSQTPPRVRAEVLRRAWEIMTAELEDCARLISLENGKAWRDAMAEATYAAEFFRWFSEETVRVPGDFRMAPNGDKTIIVDHRPIGPALLITPWNFPAAMATRKIGPALAAGCTVVLKPPAETPLTALWVADVVQRAGAPKGVVNVITTHRSGEIVSAMMADPRIVENPRPMEEVTYAEIRELAYMGASVLHDEAMAPVRESPGLPASSGTRASRGVPS